MTLADLDLTCAFWELIQARGSVTLSVPHLQCHELGPAADTVQKAMIKDHVTPNKIFNTRPKLDSSCVKILSFSEILQS